MAAARAWAQGTLVAAPQQTSTSEGDALSDAMAWGATPAEIAGLRRHLSASPSGAVSVWLANAEIVTAFCLVATQWRTRLAVIEGRFITLWDGLDYAGVRAGLAGWRIRVTPQLWSGLMTMEHGARAALNGEPL